MKAWTSATGDGRCASCRKPWSTGERMIRVQGKTWSKDYCGACGMRLFEMAEDTGEVLDVTDAPGFPTRLRPLDETPLPFDGRAAAAGKDAD